MQPRILIVDDEKHIHAALRFRLARDNVLAFSLSGGDALEKLQKERFDLCFADINMPGINGLQFIDAARKLDPYLGYVVISAYDSDENLRRTIPLQVYDFISKPLPERGSFEDKIPDWVDATRKRRREHSLAEQADTLASQRDSARLERDVEFVASESARDALMQAAGFLTNSGAHYHYASSFLRSQIKLNPSLMPLLRVIEEGRKATDAAVNVIDRFLGSAYGSRDTSPALVNEGIRDAINLVRRDESVESMHKAIHFHPLELSVPLRGLSGISFLLMMFPALSAALCLTSSNTTVGVKGDHCGRIDVALKNFKSRGYFWFNRRNALISHPGWLISITSSASALSRDEVEAWLNGEYAPLSNVTARGIIEGVQKCHGLLGFSTSPQDRNFNLLLALPT